MTFILAAVGDITLGDHPLCVGFGAHSKFKSQSQLFPYKYILEEYKNADVVFGNLECALSEKGLIKNNYDSIQMRGIPSYIKGLVDSGVDVVNFATNHSMQHGKEPFLDTLKLLDEHDIKYCGVNINDHLVAKPVFLEKNNIRIAFLGYGMRPRQYFKEPPLYTEGQEKNILKEITSIKSKVDVVIVSMHWGDEFIDRPSPLEINLARKIIDKGAHLIIGHHPHVIKGIEKYKHGYIAYSLGNFICDMIWDDRLRESLILKCTLSKTGVDEIQLIPVWINNKYQPQIMNGMAGDELVEKVNVMSKNLENYEIKDLEHDEIEYQKDADNYQRKYRKISHNYFLKNIYRFPFLILIQQIKIYFINRLDEIFKFRNE